MVPIVADDETIKMGPFSIDRKQLQENELDVTVLGTGQRFVIRVTDDGVFVDHVDAWKGRG